MPKRVNKIPSAGDKKRKEVSVSANSESSPPKKRVKKRCSVDDCTNQAKNGGVCWRHGAKKKLCSVNECTRYAKRGGVCIRHGARVEVKQCSFDDCTNIVKKGGVCVRHGAEVKLCIVDGCKKQVLKGGVCIRHGAKVERKLCSVDDCTNKVQKGGVCKRHGAKVKRGSVDGCSKQRHRRGVCRRHRTHSNIAPPPAQENFLCGNVQGGADQNNASAVVEISDNEEEGGKKQSLIAGRKRKADNVGKKSETAASNDIEEDGPVHERKEPAPTRRSKRLSTLSKPNYNFDAAYTELEGNVDGNDEGEEATDHAPSEDNEQVQLDQKRGQPETSCEGRPVTALERDVLSEEDQGQDTYAGSTKRLQINSNENNVVAGKDDEASAMVTGVDQQARLQADPVDGHEVETEQCDDMWDGANQDKDDDEEVETQDTMVLSERDSGEIDVPKQVALHQSTVPESERMVSESKEEQLQQMEERYSALGKAVKQRDTTESELRSDLADQVNITTNLQAQLDQATGENRRLQEQRVHDSDVWGEERKQMKNEYALVVHQHEVELKTRKAKIGSELQMKAAELQEMTSKVSYAESRAKSVEEELARSAAQIQAQRDEISRLNSENEDMKGRQEDALAKEVAEKNRLQAELESLRAQKGSRSEGKTTSPASSISQTDIAIIARSRETRSQSRQRQSGRGSIATDQTYPKRRTSPRGGNKSDSNMKSSLETISEGGGACLGESTRKKTAEPKKRTATRSQNGDELPHGLEKELVQKINNEIVESGQEVTFDDIAGLEDAKNTVDELVILPMQRPDLFTGLRTCPKGLLLFGPPGTGKTMIGKAIAHESGATFFSISSSSLTSKWIGEGEKLVKTLFAVASYRSPSVVFIDEIDSMLTQRKAEEDDASRRMKTEFLVQLDGAGNERKGHVLVIGATNLPHELDDAARRRFVKRLYIPLPDRAVREQQLRTLLAKNSHSLKDNEIIKLSHATDGYSCADLKNLCTDASMGPMRSLTVEERMRINADEVPPISYKHFRRSLRGMNPSVAQSDLQVYLDWNEKYGSKVTYDLDDEGDDDYDSSSSDDENE